MFESNNLRLCFKAVLRTYYGKADFSKLIPLSPQVIFFNRVFSKLFPVHLQKRICSSYPLLFREIVGHKLYRDDKQH